MRSVLDGPVGRKREEGEGEGDGDGDGEGDGEDALDSRPQGRYGREYYA